MTITRRKIVEAVSANRGISVERIVGRGRKRDVVYCRHLSIYLMYNYCAGYNFCEIGDFFGLDHTSIIRANRVFAGLVSTYEDCRANVDELATQLGLTFTPKAGVLVKTKTEIEKELIAMYDTIDALQARVAALEAINLKNKNLQIA